MLDESFYAKGFSGDNIRYVGIFENVKRATQAIRYMLTICKSNCCRKLSGETLIYEGIVSKLITWLVNISGANPAKYGKYTNLVLMENTFFILEEMR